jgi:hypothetical protein
MKLDKIPAEFTKWGKHHRGPSTNAPECGRRDPVSEVSRFCILRCRLGGGASDTTELLEKEGCEKGKQRCKEDLLARSLETPADESLVTLAQFILLFFRKSHSLARESAPQLHPEYRISCTISD